MNNVHLAVDMGSSNGKVMMATVTGDRKLQMEEVHRFPTPRTNILGHIYTDIFSMYDNICEAVTKLGRSGVQIRSLGVDAWSTDYGIINSDGKLIGLPYFYRDSRISGVLEDVVLKKISYEELYKLTPQRRVPETTLCQLIAEMRDNPHALEDGGKVLFLSDLIMYMLTGVARSEFSVASYSQMFNMKTMDWEDKIFDMFGIPKSCRVPVIHAGDTVGKVDAEFAKWCGVNRFDVIAPATHDTSSAGVCVPVESGRDDWAFIATGTWYLVSMQLDKPADDYYSCKYSLSNTGLAFKKTLLKSNISALWPIQECKRIWAKMGLDLSYGDIVEQTKKAKPFMGMIDSDDMRFFNPENMPLEICSYLKESGQCSLEPDDVGQISRIIYESLAIRCAFALEMLKIASGKKVNTLYIIGGGSVVDILNQYIADVTGTEVVTGPREASSMGNALLQAYGCGEIASLDEAREIVRNTVQQRSFKPEDTEIWKRQYEKFCSFFGMEL